MQPQLKLLPRPAPVRVSTSDNEIDILREAIQWKDEGFPTALVTLVEVRGGAARGLGAQMAVRADGRYCGYISGGCAEAVAAADAVEALERGRDRYLLLGEGSPFFDIVLPCGGGITLAIHVIRKIEPLREVVTALAARRRVSLSYHRLEEALSVVPYATANGWQNDFFLVGYRPTVRLIVAGNTKEAEMTARLGRSVGYDVEVPTRPSSTGFSDIDDDTAVALLYHDLDRELPLLEAALSAKPFYVGALGSSRTHLKRVQALRERHYTLEDCEHIKAPIGLVAKARDAATLALSVLADIAEHRMRC